MKHSAAPWEFVPATKCGNFTLKAFVRGPRSDAMAYNLEVCGDDYTGFGDEPQREADLRLLAAAPRLLAALRVALEEMENYRVDCDGYEAPEGIEYLDAAIKGAKEAIADAEES